MSQRVGAERRPMTGSAICGSDVAGAMSMQKTRISLRSSGLRLAESIFQDELQGTAGRDGRANARAMTGSAYCAARRALFCGTRNTLSTKSH